MRTEAKMLLVLGLMVTAENCKVDNDLYTTLSFQLGLWELINNFNRKLLKVLRHAKIMER